MLFGSSDGKDFAIVMLVEELSNSDSSYIKEKFGFHSIPINDDVWSDEYKVFYVLLSIVGVEDKVRLLRILGMLEKYLKYARKGKKYNFARYKRLVLEMENS